MYLVLKTTGLILLVVTTALVIKRSGEEIHVVIWENWVKSMRSGELTHCFCCFIFPANIKSLNNGKQVSRKHFSSESVEPHRLMCLFALSLVFTGGVWRQQTSNCIKLISKKFPNWLSKLWKVGKTTLCLRYISCIYVNYVYVNTKAGGSVLQHTDLIWRLKIDFNFCDVSIWKWVPGPIFFMSNF